ncbi:hypothetical protein [Propionivibrio sp.]|uniref:hypothetical protein n=1 Tax=Propionivibrio sp. TaxID=2212460 RepID=UPI0025DD4137|nr:hypothetical protein [Propionivibrio sp.]MBK7357508.1 hypothetical protein [Propionivibrio sp.]
MFRRAGLVERIEQGGIDALQREACAGDRADARHAAIELEHPRTLSLTKSPLLSVLVAVTTPWDALLIAVIVMFEPSADLLQRRRCSTLWLLI